MLYHCTSKSNGLNPGDWILPPAFTKNLREHWRRKDLDVVFLTDSLHSAKRYAKKITDPVIFEVRVTGKDWIGRTHIHNEFRAHKAKIIHAIDI